jgi:hypothetical protein
LYFPRRLGDDLSVCLTGSDVIHGDMRFPERINYAERNGMYINMAARSVSTNTPKTHVR